MGQFRALIDSERLIVRCGKRDVSVMFDDEGFHASTEYGGHHGMVR